MGANGDIRDQIILEGNHIIALFDGMKHFPDQGNQYAYPEDLLYEKDGTLMGSYRWFRDFELCYNRSWDALMPVCKKFDMLYTQGLFSDTQRRKYEELCDLMDAAVTVYDINKAYPVLRDNIKWYNSLKLYVNGKGNN